MARKAQPGDVLRCNCCTKLVIAVDTFEYKGGTYLTLYFPQIQDTLELADYEVAQSYTIVHSLDFAVLWAGVQKAFEVPDGNAQSKN